VLQIGEHVAQNGERNQHLGGDEKLRLVCAQGAQTEQRAEQGQLRKTDRAGCSGDDRSDTADFFQVSFHPSRR